MSSGGLHSLATIIKRLEAATSRLEDLAALGNSTSTVATPTGVSISTTVAATPSADSPRPVPPPHAPPEIVEIPASVIAFDEIIFDGKVKPFVELTKSFAIQSVIDQVLLVEKEYKDLRALILQASACKKPDDSSFMKILTPLQNDIEGIVHAKETNRKDRDWFNHLSLVAEGGSAVGWVTVTPKPGPYVKDIKESAEFYGNKVIKEFKEKDPKHVEWVRAYLGILEELRKYIMDNHTTGLVWNPKGVSVDQYKVPGAAPAAAPAGGAPPPPPPPPPPPVLPPAAPAAAPAAGGIGAVFADLNRGEEVTKGLRKVDKSEMTHKNPALRAGGTVPSSSTSHPAPPKKPVKPTKPHALAGKKPAKLALEGNKWMVEHQENEAALTIEDTDKSHTINLYGCKNTTVIVKGKVNAVTLVNCVKTSVLIESVISSVSVTNSPSFALQITGSAPTIQLDSTDSGQIYLSKECLGVEITTAKCSSINISLPVEEEEEGVFQEHPIPEMFRTIIKDGKLVTTPVEHAG
ncbi:adenylate cyclase associated N terminal-domain-containing protein [Abortiporus biennis]|nr:adenylate cyclase associated N terminal-domain-containing protein [Abortiporus biennis]